MIEKYESEQALSDDKILWINVSFSK